MPSKSSFIKHAKQANLDVVDVFEFGDDYAWTLNQWLKNFKKNVRKIQDLGYSNTFIRAWEFYICLSMAGFKSKRTNVMQVKLQNG